MLNKFWSKIKISKDGYIGYIKNDKFLNFTKTNFKVSVLKARLYKGPNYREKTKKFLPYDSRLKVNLKKGEFATGGCCIDEDSPKWQCRDCNKEFGKVGLGN